MTREQDDENQARFDALFYPGTRVLRNVPDLRDGDDLARFEAGAVARARRGS